MSRMTAAAIILLLETSLLLTAKWIVIVFCRRKALASFWIIICATILLSAGPTPRPPTSLSKMKLVIVVKATRKDIGTRIVFQTPA